MLQQKSQVVRSVIRALELLEAFEEVNSSYTVAELLQRVELNRATLYRLLYTLESAGYITSEGEPQRFRLGPSVARLANRWLIHDQSVEFAWPYLNELWKKTNETVSFFGRRGASRVCLLELESPHPLSFKRGTGYVEHLVRGASGHAILAYLNTPHWIIDDFYSSAQSQQEITLNEAQCQKADLLDELEKIRAQQIALSYGELLTGAVAIAAPVFGKDNEVFGSIALFGPSARIDKNQISNFSKKVQLAAKKISRAIAQL